MRFGVFARGGAAVQLTGPWTRDEDLAAGQVFEFRLWAALTEQSRGGLHVFLPLADRGIDAIIHRFSDGAYVSVQAKGRSSLSHGEVHIQVRATSLNDDRALIVAGLVTDGGLGPTLLVVPEGEFKLLAIPSTVHGLPIYSAAFAVRPRLYSRWLPYLVPSGRLVERFGVGPAAAVAPVVAPSPYWRSELGFMGEMEVARLLAQNGDLNLFRAFPDDETAELVVLHLISRRVLGVQIKTIGVDTAHQSPNVTISVPSFRPSPTTYFVVLGWLREESRFHDECLLIPSDKIESLCGPSRADGHMSFDWHPGSTSHRRLARYAHQIHQAQSIVATLLTS
jgi:hypothetical protein